VSTQTTPAAPRTQARASDPPRDPHPSSAHPAGVHRVFRVMLLVAACATLPYAVPALEAVRPWVPGSRLPFSGLFELKSPLRSAIGGVAHKDEMVRSTEDLLEAAPLPEAAPVVPEAAPGVASSDLAPHRVDPSEYAGMTRAITGPADAMAHFHARLLSVSRKEPGAMARMAVYSDSINGADQVTSTLRHLLQERFGDGGKGWVPIAPGWQYQRHQDVQWSIERKWRRSVVNRGNAPLHRYGLGGVLSTNAVRGASASFGTAGSGPSGQRVSRFRLFYQAWPGGGDVTLRLSSGDEQVVSTQASDVEDREHELTAPDGPHTLTVQAAEPETFRGYGVVLERDGPGVVVDSLQLVGAFARVLRNFDPPHWQRQVRERGVDLLVFWLGGNDSVSRSVPFVRDAFVRDYTQVIKTARGGRPKASCLVVSVLDSADKVDGQVRSRRRVPDVVAAQEEVASATGCAFLNAYEAVGGHGTVRRWYHASPRLVTGDYRHLTEAGARVVGTLFHKALLKGYDDHLARR
jgi:hypothetical protein